MDAQKCYLNNLIFGGNIDIYRRGGLKIDAYNNKYIAVDLQYNFNILGYYLNTNHNHSFTVMKFNADDSLVWSKVIAVGNWTTTLPSAIALNLDKNNNPIIAFSYYDSVVVNQNSTYYSYGLIDSNLNVYQSMYKDIILTKLDSSGYLKWIKQIKGNFDENISNSAIAIDEHNNIILTGSFGNGVEFPPYTDTAFCNFDGQIIYSFNTYIFLAKYDENGNLVWVKKAGGSGGDYGYACYTDSLNNIYTIGGLTSSNNTWFDSIQVVFNNYYNSISYIAKYNTNGKIQWIKYFYSLNHFINNTSLEFVNKRIYVFGSFYCPPNNYINFGNISVVNGYDFSNGYMAILDTNGNTLNVVTPLENKNGEINFVKTFNKEKKILVVADLDGQVIINNDTINSIGDKSYMIIEIDTLGLIKKINTIKGNHFISIYDISKNTNDIAYILGNTNNQFLLFDDDEYWTPNFTNLFFAQYSTTPNAVTNLPPSPFTIYPNPAENEFIISSPNALQATIILQNTMGQTLQTKKINGTSQSIETGNLPNGIYFLQIKNENTHYTHKIIIQH